MSIHMLQKNDKFHSCNGKRIKVLEFIGDGGQGEVYRVDYQGDKEYALKWYFSQNATQDQLEILKVLVKIGPPDHRFLWPLDIVQNSEKPEMFGYVMPFRPANFKNASGMLSRKIEPSFRTLLTACYQLSDSFLQLHSKGLSYRDISIGNIFLDPKSGDVLICDNDNVAYENTTYSGVSGTPKFMAPEVVRNEIQPNRFTDLYSLSVLLFYLMYIAHPLDGKKEAAIHAMDESAQRKLYGFEPLYIFHPTDKSNEPDPEFHTNAFAFHNVLPQTLKTVFEKAFTVGLNEPLKRVEESVWRSLFIGLCDNILNCSCGAESFYDISRLKNGIETKCWSCGNSIKIPARIRLNGEVVILSNGIKLYPHHTSGIQYDFSKPTAEISEHPTLKIKGLKNLSDDIWFVTKPDNSILQVHPGRSFALENGYNVKFGLVKAEIRL
ncbi:MAG: protein kinase [Ignavibacteriales bacterium]|nr:protein kinase [Ignavibacteriales bacterium]MCF8316042.1 protein kinase [Ignavibacteriales bacterium]MCF8437636.1 protein kinase [Ignavibacteriales bacterium]